MIVRVLTMSMSMLFSWLSVSLVNQTLSSMPSLHLKSRPSFACPKRLTTSAILVALFVKWFVGVTNRSAENDARWISTGSRKQSSIWRLGLTNLAMSTKRTNKVCECSDNVILPPFLTRWYATLENKTSAETFPKFPSVLRVIDRSDQNPPIAATSVTF